MLYAPNDPAPMRNQPPTREGGGMTTDTAVLNKLAAAVERQRIAQEAADYLKRLTVRRNLCWIAASLCFGTAGFLTVEVWTGGKHSLPTGLISWLGPGLTTFSILGGMAIQKVINKRLIIAEIRDHAPADAIELARIVTMVQQVAATQSKIIERLERVEALNERLDKLAELIPLAVDEAVRKARAAAAPDLRAAVAAEFDEAIKRARADAYVDALSGDNTVVMFPQHKRQDPA